MPYNEVKEWQEFVTAEMLQEAATEQFKDFNINNVTVEFIDHPVPDQRSATFLVSFNQPKGLRVTERGAPVDVIVRYVVTPYNWRILRPLTATKLLAIIVEVFETNVNNNNVESGLLIERVPR